MNKTRIKILPQDEEMFSVPLSIKLERLCGLRTARKVGDVETVNNYQLGQLKRQNVKYEIVKQ